MPPLLGRQTPTFAWSPPAYTTAAADEAAELQARCGQPMDPWQVTALRIGMGEDQVGLWVASEVSLLLPRQNGKGGVIEGRGMYALFVHGQQRVVYTAHLDETAINTFERVAALIERNTDLSRRVKNIHPGNTNGRVIELKTGATWTFRTRGRVASVGDSVGKSGGKGRGLQGETIFMDEALYVQQDSIDALLPTMLAQMNPQVWWVSTPPITATAALVKIRNDGHARLPRMAIADWYSEQGVDLDDEAVLAAVNPAWGIRVNRPMMDTLRRRLGPAGFARECGAIWPEPADATDRIDPQAWAELADSDSRRDGPIAVGVDIEPDRTAASVAVYGRRADALGHLQLVDFRPGTGWVVDRLVELRDALNPLGFAMGGGTFRSLETDLRAVGIERPKDPLWPLPGDLAVLSSVDMAAACAQIIDAVRQQTLRHIPAEPLDSAVGPARTRMTGDTIAWTRRDTTAPIGPLVAATEARWLFEQWAPIFADDAYDIGGSFH